MRSTIEISEEHRAQLLQLAARRGLKGLSQIVAEALEAYLASARNPEDRRAEIRKLRGSLSTKEASRLRRAVLKIRKH